MGQAYLEMTDMCPPGERGLSRRSPDACRLQANTCLPGTGQGRQLAQLLRLMQGSCPVECWVEEVEAHMTKGTEWNSAPYTAGPWG